jgi:SagB-type dehydrogenase family enzyme
MENLHAQTNHSYKSVRMNAFFLDWRTQPKKHKTYPKFHQRFFIKDIQALQGLDLIGKITFEKNYPDGVHTLRTNPSAGGLYPCEIYLQIRGVKGLLEGIYHYEPHAKALTLLHELTTDGVEYYFKNQSKQTGIIALISSVYFRSSWKYKNRALRYIFLDSGHQLGAVYAAFCVMNQQQSICFDFDKLTLNEQFGFRSDEMFTCSIQSCTLKEKKVLPLTLKLPYVSACDYHFTNSFIEEKYQQSALYEDETIKALNFFDNIETQKLQNAIVNRRSIRAFNQVPMFKEEFEFIIENIFTFASQHNITIFYTVHNVMGISQGLYEEKELKAQGDFSKRSQYLSLEQNLGGQSAVTFYFTSNEEEKYQKVNILSGFLAHIIYLKCELQSIGCSGIGAYYDQEVQGFLKTQNNILYLLAIGR